MKWKTISLTDKEGLELFCGPFRRTSHSGRFYPKKKHGTVSRTRTMHYLPHPDHPQILSGIIRKISGQAQEWNDPFSLGLPGTHFSY